MSSESPIVVGLGELLWDLLPGGRRLGGAPANFAHHANQLGMEGWVCSAVGTDAAGEELVEEMERIGLRGCLERLDLPTGQVDVELDGDGQPAYRIREGVAWDRVPFSDRVADLASRADAVCFGTLGQRDPVARRTVGRFLGGLPSHCLKIFDVNLRQGYWDVDVLGDLSHAADLLKVNDQEWAVFAEAFDLAESHREAATELCQRFGLQWIVLTRGGAGSRLFSPNGQWTVDATPVGVVDTVGAGDSFTAAVVAGLLRGRSAHETLEHATRVAAYVCSQSGATPSLPVELISSNAP